MHPHPPISSLLFIKSERSEVHASTFGSGGVQAIGLVQTWPPRVTCGWKASLLFFFMTLGLELSYTKVYEPKYEPSSELLRITAGQLFSNRELYRSVQLP